MKDEFVKDAFLSLLEGCLPAETDGFRDSGSYLDDDLLKRREDYGPTTITSRAVLLPAKLGLC